MTDSPPEQDVVTVQFDHHAPELSADPYSRYATLRECSPIAWSTAHDGFWVLSDYESVDEATRDNLTFRSGPACTIPPAPMMHPAIPIEVDAPVAQQYRRLLGPLFAPAAAKALRPSIEATATTLLDGVIEQGSCDFIDDFAVPLAARTILEMLGFETELWRDFATNMHRVIHEITSDPEGGMEAALWLGGAVMGLIEERREHGLCPDIVSLLMEATIDGASLDDVTILNVMMNLLAGGLDTTSAAFGNALIRLDEQRELRQQLLDNPSLLPQAIEELLRIDSPIQGMARNVSRDVELRGVQLRAGDRVQMLWASANRDPKVFPDPDTVDFGRTPNAHLAFGFGLHHCLGVHLARIMLGVMLNQVLQRVPDYELVDDPASYRFDNVALVYALHHLPARFTPGPRASTA